MITHSALENNNRTRVFHYSYSNFTFYTLFFEVGKYNFIISLHIFINFILELNDVMTHYNCNTQWSAYVLFPGIEAMISCLKTHTSNWNTEWFVKQAGSTIQGQGL